MNTTIEDVYDELVRVSDSVQPWNDWDSGYIAGIHLAIKLIEEVYGPMDRGEA